MLRNLKYKYRFRPRRCSHTYLCHTLYSSGAGNEWSPSEVECRRGKIVLVVLLQRLSLPRFRDKPVVSPMSFTFLFIIHIVTMCFLFQFLPVTRYRLFSSPSGLVLAVLLHTATSSSLPFHTSQRFTFYIRTIVQLLMKLFPVWTHKFLFDSNFRMLVLLCPILFFISFVGLRRFCDWISEVTKWFTDHLFRAFWQTLKCSVIPS